MSWNEAADEFKVGVATVNRLMRKDREGTSLEPLGHAGGQRHRIPDKDLKRLRRIVDRRPDATITELVEAYQLETGLRVGESTLARAMSRLGFSRKKKTVIYAERAKPRVQEARSSYLRQVARIASERLVFLDETGVHVAMMRSTAWAPVGKRAYDVAIRNRGKVLTVIGAIALDGVRATMTVEGGTTKEVFLEFVTKHLIPSLKPDDVVVMDNLGAHHARNVRAALGAAGAKSLFLPPYSPDMNPIEQCWSKLKSVVASIRATTRTALECAVATAGERIRLSDIEGWFRCAGLLNQCK